MRPRRPALPPRKPGASLNSTAAAPRVLPRRVAPSPGEARGGGRMRDRVAWALGLAVILCGFVYLLRSLVAMLFVGAVVAYLLDPIIDRMEARGLGREQAIGRVFAAIAAVIGLATLILVPSITHEFQILAKNLDGYGEQLQGLAMRAHAYLEETMGRKLPIEPLALLDELRTGFGEDEASVMTAVKDAAPNVGRWVAGALSSAVSGGLSVIISMLNLALLPIFAYYLLRDWDRLVGMVDDTVPASWRARVRRLATDIDLRLGNYVRGQITICVMMGVLYSIGLLIAGIDLAIVVGVGSGLLFIVPYLGTAVGLVLGTALALLKFGVDWHLLAVWATFAIAQGIEGFIITPKIMGDKVGLHPLVVMIALLVGANLFGIWGMLLAIPVTAAGDVLLREWLDAYRRSRFYVDESS